MPERLTLGLDVGTSATKVLLLKSDSTWEMGVWPTSEGLWNPLRDWLGNKKQKITRVGITTHGPSAVVIKDRRLCGRIISWHEPLPEECQRPTEGEQQLPDTRAWVPARLAQWEMENGPLKDGIAIQLKDLYNWELTGIIARDKRSMRGFSGKGHFQLPQSVIGVVTKNGAVLSGITEGAEVICGCDDLTAGVLGLDAKVGDLFNLANTSEHVGMVGGKPQDQMSWLPPLGCLPALCYNATSSGGLTLSQISGEKPSRDSALKFIEQLKLESANGKKGRAWKILQEINRPIEEIRNFFPSQEMLIGGGLAMIPQLVQSRNASFVAGQEVSVLGVAKLAQRKLCAVIFGAGKVGRGFLSQLLTHSGWEIILVDSHIPTVESLRETKMWDVHNLSTKKNETIVVKNVIHMSEKKSLIDALNSADLLMTSMGANQLLPWCEEIKEILFKRLQRGKIDLILAENHPRPAAAVRNYLISNSDERQIELINENLGIVQAQVLRSCIEPSSGQAKMTVQIQDHWTLPLDGDALLTNPQVKGLVPVPNFERELTRKLFTYNCVNAVVCYLGYLRGYIWLADAANDSDIAKVALAAGAESSAALVSAFDFDETEQREWCRNALLKYQDQSIQDPIERNARDPMRKLGMHDRLMGPVLLCMEHNLEFSNIMIGVAAALRYPGAKINFENEIEDELNLANQVLDDLLRRSQ